MKKIISLALVLMLLASMSVAAFAEEEKGSITLKDVAVQLNTETDEYETVATYVAYKMFDLYSYNADSKKYSYTLESEWVAFLDYSNASNKVSDYLTLNENNYVEWKEAVPGEDREPRAAELAKLALEYAKSKSLSPISPAALDQSTVKTTDGKTTGTIVFTELNLGYYLVDSSMGVLCGLTTTNPDVNMSAKNAPPTVNKLVEEDSLAGSGASWDVVNEAAIGEPINFDITITVHAGAQKYILHDKMDSGMEFVKMDSLKHRTSGGADHDLTVNTHYVLNTSPTDGCAFHVEFTDEFCNHLATGDRVVMLYTGKLNENAVIGNAGNKNEAWLTFGENSMHTSAKSITTTQTWAFDLVKVDSERNLLDGATFEIYASINGDDEIEVVAVKDASDKITHYRLAVEGDTEVADTILVSKGVARIVGLDSGTYYLKEVSPPPGGGYNVLATRKAFTIDEQDINVTINPNNNKAEIGTGVQVENKAGSILPQTGGLGTLLFTLLGGGTALGTGVVLVTKKRISKIEDED